MSTEIAEKQMEAFEECLTSKGVTSERFENRTALMIKEGIPEYNTILACMVDFTAADDGSNSSIQFYTAFPQVFEDEKKISALEACNGLNMSYRYIRAYLDDEGKMCMSGDVRTSDCSTPENWFTSLVWFFFVAKNYAYPAALKVYVS